VKRDGVLEMNQLLLDECGTEWERKDLLTIISCDLPQFTMFIVLIQTYL
jgi:hypothetical protein